MIKLFALAVSIAVSAGAGAQGAPTETPAQAPAKKIEAPPTVTVASKGHDVRLVLHDMFKQVGKSFVLEPNIRFGLYLAFEKVEFEEALRLVCRIASLDIDVQNGIYFITKTKPAVSAAPATAVKGSFEAKPKGKLPESVLGKRLTTRADKADIRALVADIGKQTGVTLEVAADVPAFKLDAYLLNTSLKYALDTICSAAKLQYKFTDNLSIEISKAEPSNGVKIVGTP